MRRRVGVCCGLLNQDDLATTWFICLSFAVQAILPRFGLAQPRSSSSRMEKVTRNCLASGRSCHSRLTRQSRGSLAPTGLAAVCGRHDGVKPTIDS